MEPNENGTLNLGANIPQNGYAQTYNDVNQQAQAQVVQQTTTFYTPENPTNLGVVTNSINNPPQVNIQPNATPVQNQNVNVGNIVINPNADMNTVQHMTNFVEPIPEQVVSGAEQVTTNTETKTEEPKPELVPSDEIIIGVKELQALVSKVKKVATNEPLIPISGIFYIVIDRNGFSISADNNVHTITATDKSRSYNKEVKICVDSAKFGDLVLALNDGMIKIEYDEVQHSITLYTDSGYFKFAESIDLTSGTSLTISHKFSKDYETMKPIKMEEFRDTIAKTRPIRTSAGEKKLQGVYFTDLVLCSDNCLMFMQQGVPSLEGTEFFIDSRTADLMASISFVPDKVRIGTVNDTNGVAQAVILDDGYTVLSVRTTSETSLPVDVCRNFWNKTFPDTVTLNVAQCVGILKRAEPFININSDKELADFDVNGNKLTITTISGQSKETVEAANNQNASIHIKLPVKKLLNVLQTITGTTFDLTTSPETTQCICLTYDGYKCVVAAGQDV